MREFKFTICLYGTPADGHGWLALLERGRCPVGFPTPKPGVSEAEATKAAALALLGVGYSPAAPAAVFAPSGFLARRGTLGELAACSGCGSALVCPDCGLLAVNPFDYVAEVSS